MTLITGDFNYPGIRWVDGSGFVNSDIGVEYEFTNLLSDAFLYQLVDAPTRGVNTLDLVLSNNVDLDTVFVENTNGLPSDHNHSHSDSQQDKTHSFKKGYFKNHEFIYNSRTQMPSLSSQFNTMSITSDSLYAQVLNNSSTGLSSVQRILSIPRSQRY